MESKKKMLELRRQTTRKGDCQMNVDYTETVGGKIDKKKSGSSHLPCHLFAYGWGEGENKSTNAPVASQGPEMMSADPPKKGIGTVMMAEVMNDCQENGIKYVQPHEVKTSAGKGPWSYVKGETVDTATMVRVLKMADGDAFGPQKKKAKEPMNCTGIFKKWFGKEKKVNHGTDDLKTPLLQSPPGEDCGPGLREYEVNVWPGRLVDYGATKNLIMSKLNEKGWQKKQGAWIAEWEGDG